MKIDMTKMTHIGSMNYILQVWQDDEDETKVTVDQYQPRKNIIWTGEMDKTEAVTQIQETMERMKIAIQLFQDFIDGKITHVYYWEVDEK
jgi:hypothetical protein